MSTIPSNPSNGPSSAGAGATGSTTEQAKEKVQETAQQAAGQARGQLRDQVDQRSTEAGQKVSTVADDVRTVGSTLREQGKDQPAKIADRAAEQAQKVGDYLQHSDADAILRDAEDFGRRQPWAVMAGGLALGLLASRFLKASSSRRYSRFESSSRLPARRQDVVPGAGLTARPPEIRREPGLTEPVPGRPAQNVSLSGGVTP